MPGQKATLFQQQEQIMVFKGDEEKPYLSPRTKFAQLSSTVCAKKEVF